MAEIKRSFKDSVFKKLFGSYDKKYLLELYKALYPEDTTASVDDLTVVSIESVIVDSIYNDLGFRIRDHIIILVEAQSTWSINIIIRLFLYLAQTYQDYIYKDEKQKKKLYSSSKITIPRPEVYVIYTGEDKGIKKEYSLKEEFFPGDEICLDLRVKVISSKDERKDIIGQYIEFCHTVKNIVGRLTIENKISENPKSSEEILKSALGEAIHICIDKNVLADFLKVNKMEVESVMLRMLSQEELFDIALSNAKDEAKAEGRAEGKAEGKIQGLEALVSICKNTYSSAQDLFNVIVLQPAYKDITIEDVLKYY